MMPLYVRETHSSRGSRRRRVLRREELPFLDRSKLFSRERARERYEAALTSVATKKPPLRAVFAEEAQVRPNALRLRRRYESLSDEGNPIRVEKRLRAAEAAAAADAAHAQRVATKTLLENEERRLREAQRRLREAEDRLVCVPRTLDLRIKDPSSAKTLPEEEKNIFSLRENFQLEFPAGVVGRLKLFQDYGHAKTLCGLEETAVVGPGTMDPRWIALDFAREAMRRGESKPSAALLKGRNGALKLRGLGLSDGVVYATATVLPRIGPLSHIDLADNQIGDEALAAFCDAVRLFLPTLEVLDFSKNKIGNKAARGLRSLLSSGHGLRILVLEDADLDDYECADLTKSLQKNDTLKELYLARNSIGQLEERNVLNNPDLLTGPEAIAEGFQAGHVVLGTLDLSWNFIRKESATALGKALRNLVSLKDLRLAHNCFGDEPTQHLAAALHSNTALEALDLSFNSITTPAALVLGAMLKVNGTLRTLKLDGNPLGRRGAASLLAALQARRRRQEDLVDDDDTNNRTLHLSLRQCDTTREADASLFDSREPAGVYRLHLIRPYDRMIALELLSIATHRDHCAFKKITFLPPPPEDNKRSLVATKSRDIRLHRQGGGCSHKIRRAPLVATARRGPKPPWTLLLARTMSQHCVAREDLDAVLDWLGFDLSADDADAVHLELEASLRRDLQDQLAGGTQEEEERDHQEEAQAEKNIRPRSSSSVRRRSSATEEKKTTLRRRSTSAAEEKRRASVSQAAEKRRLSSPSAEKRRSSTSAAARRSSSFICGRPFDDAEEGPPLVEEAPRAPALDKTRFMRELLHAIFVLADKNASGGISKSELKELLQAMGIAADMGVVARCVAAYDSDDSGIFEEEEFVAFATKSFVSEEQEPKRALCCLEDGERAWRVPEEGVLEIDFEAQPALPSEDEVGTDHGVATFVALLEKATTEQERTMLFDVATEAQADFFLTAEQARLVFAAAKNAYSPVEKVARLLPLVVSPSDSSAFIETHLKPPEKVDLRNYLGSALFALLVGNATGHYVLNFRNAMHRVAARKLAAIAKAESATGHEDTSQHANGWNFRNERFNGRPLCVTPNWFANLDDKDKQLGTLEFDYVSTHRPPRSASPMSTRRFQKLLRLLDLEGGKEDAAREPRGTDETIAGEHKDLPFEDDSDPYAATSGGATIKKEDTIGIEWREWFASSSKRITPSLYSESWELSQKLGAAFLLKPAKKKNVVVKYKKEASSKTEKTKKNAAGEATTTKVPSGNKDLFLGERPPMEKKAVDATPTRLYRAFARCLHALKANIGHHYFSTAQVLDLLARFPAEQSLRVELAVAVFSRVVDRRNFSRVVDALGPDDQLELCHRLGHLNVLNSASVDRRYLLHLKVPDENKMASILVKLAVAEPGENWCNESFRRKESMDAIPGWQLPMEWSAEVIHYGILDLCYSSRNRGCKADPAFRHSLMPNFLCGWPPNLDDDEDQDQTGVKH